MSVQFLHKKLFKHQISQQYIEYVVCAKFCENLQYLKKLYQRKNASKKKSDFTFDYKDPLAVILYIYYIYGTWS